LQNHPAGTAGVEVENFSGKTNHAIEQDFYATVVTGNVRALLAGEAEGEEEQTYRGKYKYDYKINKNISISVLKDDIIEVLFDPERDLKMFCEQMKKAMKKSIIPIRPERKFPHIRKTFRKYPMNRRRAL
jgi:predicted DNA-binding ArsR family transcriptional regulator